MTTRRPIPSSSTASPPQTSSPEISTSSSSTTPAVAPSTIYKLLFFSGMMFSLPLLSYFGSVNALFGGNTSYAGALAALVANVVLGGYVWVAVLEDQGGEWGVDAGGGVEGKGKKAL